MIHKGMIATTQCIRDRSWSKTVTLALPVTISCNITYTQQQRNMPATTLITSLPTFVNAEEHKILVGSTPASFADIPPKLYHKEDNVSVTLDPPLENFTTQDGAQGSLYVIARYVEADVRYSIMLFELFILSAVS